MVTDRLDNAAAALAEHYDSVQIVVSRVNEDGETVTESAGRGNWHARRGSVDAWRLRQDVQLEADAVREAEEDDG